MKKHTAIYPGTFDPLTIGHVNIIERALPCFDELLLAVAVNIKKQTLFSDEERVAMIQEIVDQNLGSDPRVKVLAFDGLLVHYAATHNVDVILRGVRTVQDFEYEFQMAQANRQLNPNIETMFMMTEGKYAYISSSIIKEIVRFGGSVSEMVTPSVEARLKQRLQPE